MAWWGSTKMRFPLVGIVGSTKIGLIWVTFDEPRIMCVSLKQQGEVHVSWLRK